MKVHFDISSVETNLISGLVPINTRNFKVMHYMKTVNNHFRIEICS